MWLPDLFAKLWLQLVGQTSEIYAGDWQGRRCQEAKDILKVIRSAASAETPDAVLNYLAGAHPIGFDICEVTDLNQRAFVVAQCIDACLEPFHPRYRHALRFRRAMLNQGLRDIDEFYLRNGWFNEQTEAGLILPKTPLRPGWIRRRPDVSENQLRDCFRILSLYREPEVRAHSVSVKKLKEHKDIDGRSIARAGLRLALIPLAVCPKDLKLTTQEKKGGRLDIELEPSREALLAEMASAALHAANAAGAQIAVFPELVVSRVVRKAIEGTLRKLTDETDDDDRFTLQLVAAGSGPVTDTETGRTFNESVVFGRFGWELWRQRKLTQYSPPVERLRQWEVEVGIRPKYRENFHGGSELKVIDSLGGRMTVLICQDLSEDEPSGRVMRELRPDWVFCPVLDSELAVGRWTHQQGMPLAARYGVSMIVVNNLDLPRRERRRGRRFGVGLCIDRDQPYRCNIAKCQAPPQRLATSRLPVVEVVQWRPHDWRAVRIGFQESSKTHR